MRGIQNALPLDRKSEKEESRSTTLQPSSKAQTTRPDPARPLPARRLRAAAAAGRGSSPPRDTIVSMGRLAVPCLFLHRLLPLLSELLTMFWKAYK